MTAKKFAEIDSVRYSLNRKYYIKELIDIWLRKNNNEKTIICLQEVNNELLELLKQSYKLRFTTDLDLIILTGNVIEKKESRVTI